MRVSLTTASLGLFGLLLLLASLARGAEVEILSPEDHFRHPMRDRFYTEVWGCHFMAETGELLSISFVYSNVGLTSGSAAVQFTWSETGAEPVVVKDERGQSEFREDRSIGLIAVGPHTLTIGDAPMRLRFAAKEVGADLTLRSWMPGFRIADGTTVINREKGELTRMFVETPRGDFAGTVTVHGQARPITGAVFVEHTVSNVSPTSYSAYWYSLRSFFPTHTVVFVGFRYLPQAGGGSWDFGYVTDRDRVLIASTHCQVVPNGVYQCPRGRQVPATFTVALTADDLRLSGTYQSLDLCSSTPVLENLNWLLRKAVATFVGDPMIYRFRSNASLRLQHSGLDQRLEGPAYQGVAVMKD